MGLPREKNRHLLETTRALLFEKQVPKDYWGEAVLTAAHLINRLPSRVLGNKTPISVLSQFYPEFNKSNHFPPKIFGSVSYVHIHTQNRGKLGPRAVKCVFLGYSSTQKGYKCYHPNSKKILSQKMLPLLKINLSLRNLIFRGIVHWKIRLV